MKKDAGLNESFSINLNLEDVQNSSSKCPKRVHSEVPLLMASTKEGLETKTYKDLDLHSSGVKHPTSFIETFINLLKGNIGAGLFAMGDAFKNAGLLAGPLLTIFLGVICVYGNHILVNSSIAIMVKKKLDKPPPFAETVQMCFEEGPKAVQAWASTARFITYVFITVTQLGFCSVYFVFISSTLKKVLEPNGISYDIHVYMIIILLPILATALVRNLKFLTPFSLLANICLGTGIVLTLYISCQDLPPLSTRAAMADWRQIPLFFGTTIYAFEGISLVLPLQNEMKNPHKFDKTLGVLNIGMSVVCGILVSIGFIGYLKYGDNVQGSLTLNLPHNELFSEIVQLVISVGILLTYALQFYVPIKIIWPIILEKYGPFNHPVMYEELFRTFMVLLTFILAESVPHLGLFISLVGAICGTTLALILPPICDIVLRWPSDFGDFKWRLILNIFSLIVAAVGLITGTYYSTEAIIQAYYK